MTGNFVRTRWNFPKVLSRTVANQPSWNIGLCFKKRCSLEHVIFQEIFLRFFLLKKLHHFGHVTGRKEKFDCHENKQNASLGYRQHGFIVETSLSSLLLPVACTHGVQHYCNTITVKIPNNYMPISKFLYDRQLCSNSLKLSKSNAKDCCYSAVVKHWTLL